MAGMVNGLLSLQLLLLVAAVALLVWGGKDPVYGKLVKWVGYVVILAAVLMSLCTVYTGFTCYRAGGSCMMGGAGWYGGKMGKMGRSYCPWKVPPNGMKSEVQSGQMGQ